MLSDSTYWPPFTKYVILVTVAVYTIISLWIRRKDRHGKENSNECSRRKSRSSKSS